ncbi:hypothetical protein HXY32_05200 [Candidatus Bathyarchaeota archaeon]|nr:hypothetical protein [Candidatus Bathyarchaeota archaeon]
MKINVYKSGMTLDTTRVGKSKATVKVGRKNKAGPRLYGVKRQSVSSSVHACYGHLNIKFINVVANALKVKRRL